MSTNTDPPVDWSQGTVIVHNGGLFCSPNCQRAVLIPDESQARLNPFDATRSACPNAFQPVWWDFSHGWLAFVPLSPSFLSLPFIDLCWHPRIEATSKTTVLPSGQTKYERRYQVRSDDAMKWFEAEQRMSRAAESIRLFFHIPGILPPLPSTYGLTGLHRSQKVAERCVNESRKSFVVWMGFLSYLIAQTARPEYTKIKTSLLPPWYQALLDKSYQRPWLDGLINSTVCSFEANTLRSGIILPFPNGKHQPPVQWFLKHHIPCWYHLTRHTEEYLRTDNFFAKLIPPAEKLQHALTLLFTEPRMPLVAYVLKSYVFFEWGEYGVQARQLLDMRTTPSIVLTMCGDELARRRYDPRINTDWDNPVEREKVLREMDVILAEREAQIRNEVMSNQTYIQQGMIAQDKFNGAHTTLHENWATFFEKRAAREEEHLQTETEQARQARLSREKQRPTKKCKMYVWEKVQTMGGGYVYARTLATQSEHSSLVREHSAEETKFYARTGEWDFFEEFDPGFLKRKAYAKLQKDGSGDEDEEGVDGQAEQESDNSKDEQAVSAQDNIAEDRHETVLATDPAPATDNTEKHTEALSATDVQEQCVPILAPTEFDDYSPQSPTPSTLEGEMNQDDGRIIERAQLIFGFVPAVGDKEFPGALLDWKEVLRILGTSRSGHVIVSSMQQTALQLFFKDFLEGSALPTDLDDLCRSNHWYLKTRLHSLPFTYVSGYYIFTLPSSTTTWYIGVGSAAAVVYILRVLARHPGHYSAFTVASQLLSTGMRFRTFELMPKFNYHALDAPFEPKTYRPAGYKFTADDFQASMLQTRALLNTDQGRAALLRGGIVARIAREYMELDRALDGPSLEATCCHHGLRVEANDKQNDYWDDDLTEHELAIICGTYFMYTGK